MESYKYCAGVCGLSGSRGDLRCHSDGVLWRSVFNAILCTLLPLGVFSLSLCSGTPLSRGGAFLPHPLPLKTGEGISTPLFLPPPHLPKNFQLFESHIRGLYSDPSLVVQHLVTSWGELEACCHLLHDSVICFLVVSISTCLSAAPLPAWLQNACKI